MSVANKSGGVRSNESFGLANADNERWATASNHEMVRIKNTKHSDTKSPLDEFESLRDCILETSFAGLIKTIDEGSENFSVGIWFKVIIFKLLFEGFVIFNDTVVD